MKFVTPICQKSFLKAISSPHSQEATQYSMGGPLFQAGQQWQVDQWWAQEVSRKQSVPLLRCRRPQVGLLFQEADHGLSQRPQCFSNCWYSGSCFWETLGKIESDPKTLHRLRAMLNFPMQQQVRFDSTHPLFLILIHFLLPLLLPWSLVRITSIKSRSEPSLTLGLLIAL